METLSTSQKKRLRKRNKVLVASTTPVELPKVQAVAPEVPPVAPEVPFVSRAELEARVKKLREEARGKRMLTKRAQVETRTKDATRVGKDLMEQFRTGTLSKRQLESLADLEKEFYEDCRGDAAVFCAKKQLDTRAAAVIESAINRVKAGETPESTLKDTVTSLASALSK